MKSLTAFHRGEQEQQHRQKQHQPMFDFTTMMNKIPNPDKQKQPRTLNESLNTCPLTISQLTVDASIRSSGSTTASSQMSHPLGRSPPNDGGGLGVTTANQPQSTEKETPLCFGSIQPCPEPELGRRESEGSWPAESPDPLCATARAASPMRNGSPPPHNSPQHSSEEALGIEELPALSPEAEELLEANGSIKGERPSRKSSSSSGHGLYQPVRHHRLSQSLYMESNRSESQSSAVNGRFVPTKTDDASHARRPSRRCSLKIAPRRSSFSTPLNPMHATVVFVDLEGYSKSSDVHQRQLTCDFMTTLRNLLTFAYGETPVRGKIDNYVILPTGDGAAVIVIKPPRRIVGEEEGHENETSFHSSLDGLSIDERGCLDGGEKGKKAAPHQIPLGINCAQCERQSLRTTEETALWIGSSLLLWASKLRIGMRVGLNSGELCIVEDPYGDPNVCGDAINMAARIMDTALPGQILASASTVVPNLNLLAVEDLAAGDLIGAYQDLGLENSDRVAQIKKHEDIFDLRSQRMERDEKECVHCPRVRYEIATEPNEVVVKHGVTATVQSITCQLHPLPRPEDLPPELLPNFPLASASEGGEASVEAGGDDVPKPLHPLALIKSNPKKQSFASLSSLQPSGGSNSSLRGSLRNSLRPSRRESDSNSERSPLRAQRNESWKLGESFSKEKCGTRMSQLSQLSNEEIGANLRTQLSSNPRSEEIGASFRTQVTSNLSSEHVDQLPIVGNHKTPATKWYMKIKPTEMQSKGDQIKPKVLPQELIRRHQRIAFLGIMHDNLSKGFVNILENDPGHRWEQVYILFPSDGCLENHLANNFRDQPVEKLIFNKRECWKNLRNLLAPVVRDLRFLQYDQLMHCGSYWDWRDPGGFIHISPLTWGANPKTCPAMNYYWNSREPSPEYRVYRDGLEYLLETAKGFDEDDVPAGVDEVPEEEGQDFPEF